MEPILRVTNLKVVFGDNETLKNLDFSVNKGDVFAIVGPNGAGKSVLFKALLGLIPFSGEIKWADNLKIGYVPQKFSIEKDMPLSVGEFLSLKNKNKKYVIETLDSLGLFPPNKEHDHVQNHHHHQHSEFHIQEHILKQRLGWLSGGQLQRVLIAWALLDNPDVLLFDEPTSGIDVGGEETIYHLLKKLHDELKLTILLISHDLNVVYKYANTVMCVNKKMLCYGIPANVLDPRALTELYGGETGFYQHQKHDH